MATVPDNTGWTLNSSSVCLTYNLSKLLNFPTSLFHRCEMGKVRSPYFTGRNGSQRSYMWQVKSTGLWQAKNFIPGRSSTNGSHHLDYCESHDHGCYCHYRGAAEMQRGYRACPGHIPQLVHDRVWFASVFLTAVAFSLPSAATAPIPHTCPKNRLCIEKCVFYIFWWLAFKCM